MCTIARERGLVQPKVYQGIFIDRNIAKVSNL